MATCSMCGAQNAEGAKFCNNCGVSLLQAAEKVSQEGTHPLPDLPSRLQPGQKATLMDYLSHYQGLQVHWAKRFVGIILDSIFVVVPVFVILFVMEWWSGWLWFVIYGGIILFLYSALLEDAYGATIGKSIVGLRVVSIPGRLELPSTLLRNLTKIFALLLLLEFLVTLFVQTTDAHQRYMDKLAKTTVVERRR